MTTLNSPVTRRLIKPLDGTFCRDAGATIVATLLPGTDTVPDMIEIRPLRSRRPERLALCDVYRLALRARVSREVLERARETKAQKAAKRIARKIKAAERRLFKS